MTIEYLIDGEVVATDHETIPGSNNLNEGPFSVSVTRSLSSVSLSLDGEHELDIRATDAAGNEASLPLPVTFEVADGLIVSEIEVQNTDEMEVEVHLKTADVVSYVACARLDIVQQDQVRYGPDILMVDPDGQPLLLADLGSDAVQVEVVERDRGSSCPAPPAYNVGDNDDLYGVSSALDLGELSPGP